MCMRLRGCALFNLIFCPLAWPCQCLSKTLNAADVCLYAGGHRKVSQLHGFSHSTTPSWTKHTNTLMQIWERMNQSWEMHLHNLLTTHSHLNHYTISQVSSVNVQEPAGKKKKIIIWEMLFHQTARQQRSECVHVGGRVKRNDWCQRLWTGLTKPARTTALHGCQLDEWPRCTGEPLRTRWVALKFTFHCQTFASCNEFLHGKIWSIFLLNVTTIERSYETCKSWSLCSCFRLYHELPEAHAKELWQHKISHSFWSFHL